MVCGWCMLLDNHCIAIAADLHAMVFCVWRWRYNFFLPGEYLPLASWRFRFTCGLNVLYGAERGSATTVSPKGWKNGHHVYYFRHINTHIYTYTDELIAFLGVWTWCVCVFACVQSKNKILRTRERSEAFSLIYLYLCTVWPNNNGKYVVIYFLFVSFKAPFSISGCLPGVSFNCENRQLFIAPYDSFSHDMDFMFVIHFPLASVGIVLPWHSAIEHLCIAPTRVHCCNCTCNTIMAFCCARCTWENPILDPNVIVIVLPSNGYCFNLIHF